MQAELEKCPQDELQANVFNKLLKPALEKVNEQEQQISYHHNQKYRYCDFFRALIYFFTTDILSLRLFINTYLNKGLLPENLGLRKVAYTTFGEAFERFPVVLFQSVFEHLLSSLKFKSVPELEALGKLYCIDGSLFPVIASMQWAKYTSKHQALKLHLVFELNRMIPVSFLIGSGNSSERNALRKQLEAGITYIADRGYMCFQLFDDIQTACSCFVFRVKNNLDYVVIEPLMVQLPKTVLNLFSNLSDNKIRCPNDKNQNVYRLVQFQIGSEPYFILTNRFDLTTFQIICIYAYRWQIELVFRFLKRTLAGVHLIKNDQKGVTIQFYALLITALLQLHLKQEILEQIEPNEQIEPSDNPNPVPVTCSKSSEKPNENQANISEPLETCFDEDIPTHYHDRYILGNKTKKYWKISIHWLKALISLLAEPFDDKAIEILGAL